MAKDTTTDHEHADDKDRDNRVVAAEKKTATKKAAKKKTTKKAAGKKAASKKITSKKTASKKTASKKTASKAAASGAPAASVAPRPAPASTTVSYETRSGGPMRGIVALWGPLAIIVLLIVVARIGEEEPDKLAERAATGLASSLESAEGLARDVVEDVQDALTGGDPEAAAALGAGAASPGDSGSQLAAAFKDAGVVLPPGEPAPGSAPPPAPEMGGVPADPWSASTQSTTPTSVSEMPGVPPPHPDNPWAPVDPREMTALPDDPYATGAGIPPPGAAPGYGSYAGESGQAGGYPPAAQAYPPLPPAYGGAPPAGYGGYPPAYPRQPAYGSPPPAYATPPAYGAAPGYPYPPPYGAPAPYQQPGYYPPAQ